MNPRRDLADKLIPVQDGYSKDWSPLTGSMPMDASMADFSLAGSLEELRAKGRLVVHGGHRPILVVYDRGRVFALDNRCPHMGFPLERGSVEDGILTCHWHHARFDLESGCTFDLWADDAPICPVKVHDGEVWVKTTFGRADRAAHWRERLDSGLAHDISLVIAKAVLGQLAADVPQAGIVRQVALFGAQNRDGWGVGLTILTALANLLPILPEEEAYLALFHGARRVAADCDGEPPRRERAPLESQPEPAVLKRWLRRWTSVRHREAAERTLLTAIAAGTTPSMLADALLAATTERAFADGGHSLDFINKAFECLDLVGWEHATALLPTVVGQMVAARGAEELTSWRQPVDLVALCDEAAGQLRELFAADQRTHGWSDHSALARELLGDDPTNIIDALKAAILAGAAPSDLGRSLAYGAALRVARFGNVNEHADWETAHHVFTYANALDQLLKRIGITDNDSDVTAVRGVLHGAMALYLTRYLNVPPARIPGEGGERLDDLPADEETIRAALLDAFDRQRQVDLAARLVARHLAHGHSPQTADRHARARGASGRCRLSCVPDAGGRGQAIRRLGRHRRGPAHPHRGRPISRRPLADRTRGVADGGHRPPLDARRRAASERRGAVTPGTHDPRTLDTTHVSRKRWSMLSIGTEFRRRSARSHAAKPLRPGQL